MAAYRSGRGTFLSFGEARKKRRIPTVQVGTLVLFLFFMLPNAKLGVFSYTANILAEKFTTLRKFLPLLLCENSFFCSKSLKV